MQDQQFDKDQFVYNYVDAAVNQDIETLQNLPNEVENLSTEDRIELVEDILEGLDQHEGMSELIEVLRSQLNMLKMVQESEQYSSGEDSEETNSEVVAAEAVDPSDEEAEQESAVESVGVDSAEED